MPSFRVPSADFSFSRRRLLQGGAAALGGLAAYGLGAGSLLADIPEAVVAAGKASGRLNTIALPPDWANYGKMISTFEQKYGITIHNQSPNASSAQELQAIRSLKGQDRAPDAVDVGPSFAIQGQQEGLFAPYKVSTWDSIPEAIKDKDGYWYADYFGVISFGVNKSAVSSVPQSWDDLKKPEYRNQIALNGSPMGAAAAFAGVWAAALANGGSLDDIAPGVAFFAELAQAGNFVPVGATPATIESGQTPIVINWDYLNLAYKTQFAQRADIEVVIPEGPVFGNYYCQAISAFAPNPDAAKLWMEFVYSDEGQLIYLEGFAHPARFTDMVKRQAIPAELMAKLPPAEPYEKVTFPNNAQTKKAQDVVQAQWQQKVGG